MLIIQRETKKTMEAILEKKKKAKGKEGQIPSILTHKLSASLKHSPLEDR